MNYTLYCLSTLSIVSFYLRLGANSLGSENGLEVLICALSASSWDCRLLKHPGFQSLVLSAGGASELHYSTAYD